MKSIDDLNKITGKIINAAYKVHADLGPGLLESSYKACMHHVLTKSGLSVETEKSVPLVYEEVRLEIGYRLDLFVENSVVVEIKSVESLNDVHIAQVLTYLKLTKTKVALLFNFNVADMKKGIKRLIL